MLANHKPGWVSVDGQKEPVHVEPGQFITGRYSLHKLYYPKKKKRNKAPLTLWRWLKVLENLENLIIQTNMKYSLITINNWKTYQIEGLPNEPSGEQQTNNRRTTDEQPTITNKNDLRMNKNEQEGVFVKPFVSQIDPAEIEADLAERRRLRREFNL